VGAGIKKFTYTEALCELFIFKVLNSYNLPVSQEVVNNKDYGRLSGSQVILRAPTRFLNQWHIALCNCLQRRIRKGILTPFTYQALEGTMT
jgi:hypothetical protein